MSEAIDEDVLARLRPELVRLCYRMLGDAAAAEDAAQDALLKLWGARHRYDPARASVRTWAFTIASRHCLDLLRAAPRRALPTDLTGGHAPATRSTFRCRRAAG